MRVSVAERARLSVLIGRRAFRSLLGRINAHPLLRWRFASTKTDRLVIAPQDLRTADPTRASEIYAGRFAFAGKIVICDGRSPFEIEPPSDEWADQLLGFGWLRHLRAAESGITRANARALVDEWISVQGSWDPVACHEPCTVIHSSTRARALARVMPDSAARRWRSQPKPSRRAAHSSDGGAISNGERPSLITTLPAKANRPA